MEGVGVLDSKKRLSFRWEGCGRTNRRCLSTSPSDPKAFPLFGLVEDHLDEFEGIYEERFAEKHGFWRPVVRKVADWFLDCGDLRHGFARILCENPECRREFLLAFSCHGR